ncbi:MAG: cytochrome c3 family protein [Bryobacteraceae bacterium]
MRGVAALAALLLAGRFIALPQDIDTALRPESPRQTTILDQIEDRGERRDFLALYNERDPAGKHALAEGFVSAHPRSWFLAEAYEAAAKSSIELGRYDRALDEARQSLQLFPENPLLLVPLANLEARAGLPRAESDANYALELVDEFGPPALTNQADWVVLKAQLTASARFALGRVYASEGLRKKGAERGVLLKQAFDQLTLAAQANKDDAEIWLLRGMVQEAMGDNGRAASNYAQASKVDSGLRQAALAHLKQIYSSAGTASQSFDAFVRDLPPATIEQTNGTVHSSSKEVGHYAGSAACQECHKAEYDSWRQTGMGRMLRPYQRENVFGDFRNGTEFKDESGSVVARMGFSARPYMEIRSINGVWQRFYVDYTIGSKWQQAYAVETAGGRLQVLPIQYSKLEGRWLDYWRLIDPPGSVRAEPAQFSMFAADTNYQVNCAVCHTSQLKAASAEESALERASFREPGINCEMCHGPSKDHVDRMHGGRGSYYADSKLPVDFARVNNREGVAICAQCHRQSALHRPNALAELNYSSNGASFIQNTVSRPYPEFLRRAFYKDGRFRETTFIVEAFVRSNCYRKGNAQCASCHDPHPANSPANRVSLKFLDEPDRMCLQCHRDLGRNVEAHTHHASSSVGSRCVSCHMPKIMNSLMFEARSHQIDDIPDASMTVRFGQEQSPNACLMCHKEHDALWVGDELRTWRRAVQTSNQQ